MKKLFYCEDEGEFYWVTGTPKTLTIEWAAKENCDSEKTPLDFNVRWHTLKVPLINKGKHCLKEFTGDYILVYPFQAGIPFALDLATEAHIKKEIDGCLRWGTSSKFHEGLTEFLTKKI